MTLILPFFSLFLSFILGFIVTKRISIYIPRFSFVFIMASLGIVLFTAVNYFASLLFSFPLGIIIGQIVILTFEIVYIVHNKLSLNLLPVLYDLFKEKLLVVPIFVIGIILYILFNHHVLGSVNGDLYTGGSAYGDLPFHLSIISSIAYGNNFPPNHPMFSGNPLVYPYLIDFFSAILVYEGWSLRQSIVILGLILSISLIGLIYDLTFNLTKSSLKSFLAVILYFFNGGLGYYFFLKDYSFNFAKIIQALSQPTLLKNYSHLSEQNIQWGNFLSQMIVPERSLLFGIPTGIIILRLLFFRNTDKHPTIFDLVLIAFLLSLMPLLHTHTVLAMIIILPALGILMFDRHQGIDQFTKYTFIASLAVIFAVPSIPLFLNHLSGSESFFKFQFWWMKANNESPVYFWFKNSYLFIPLSLIILTFSNIANKYIRTLQVVGLILLVVINLVSLSPFSWDNVKFLFWAGLFFAIGAASFFGYLFQKRNFYLTVVSAVVIITMVSSALLSIWKEVNTNLILFSKEAVLVGEQIRKITSPYALFLTYKVHNSPINSLAGRSIIMGYPGLLWTQGINYYGRERDVNKIYSGSDNAKQLINSYGIDYVVVESYNPSEESINRLFFNQFPILLKTENYIIYKVR